jgi:hypothetical protein
MSRFEFLADDRAEAISGGYGGWSLPMIPSLPGGSGPSKGPSTSNKLSFTKVVATTDVTSTQKNYNNSQAALLGFVKTSQFNNASIDVNNKSIA